MDMQQQVIDFAKQQAAMDQQAAMLREQIAALEALHITPLKNLLKLIEQGKADADSSFRAFLLEQFKTDGDQRPHPSIEIRMRPVWKYDRAAALALAQEHAPDLVKVERSLKVRDLESAISNGEVSWLKVEKELIPTVAIGKLGEYVLDQKPE